MGIVLLPLERLVVDFRNELVTVGAGPRVLSVRQFSWTGIHVGRERPEVEVGALLDGEEVLRKLPVAFACRLSCPSRLLLLALGLISSGLGLEGKRTLVDIHPALFRPHQLLEAANVRVETRRTMRVALIRQGLLLVHEKMLVVYFVQYWLRSLLGLQHLIGLSDCFPHRHGPELCRRLLLVLLADPRPQVQALPSDA